LFLENNFDNLNMINPFLIRILIELPMFDLDTSFEFRVELCIALRELFYRKLDGILGFLLLTCEICVYFWANPKL
jgi:hypothetical protein